MLAYVDEGIEELEHWRRWWRVHRVINELTGECDGISSLNLVRRRPAQRSISSSVSLPVSLQARRDEDWRTVDVG